MQVARGSEGGVFMPRCVGSIRSQLFLCDQVFTFNTYLMEPIRLVGRRRSDGDLVVQERLPNGVRNGVVHGFRRRRVVHIRLMP